MLIMDFEASSLSRQSFPIEIAWIDTQSGQRDSFLIDPRSASHWHDLQWAGHIHGISLEMLHQQGIGVLQAAQRLNQALQGRQVFSDASDWDGHWLHRLYDATLLHPSFELKDLYSHLAQYRDYDLIEQLQRQSRPHRALDDVAMMAELINKRLPQA